MKKTVLLLLCVLLLLSLCGCDEPIKNIDPSTNDTEIFQPAPTIAPPLNVYVGMTRARSLLYLTYSGNVSSFLNEFNPDYYNYLSDGNNKLDKPERTVNIPVVRLHDIIKVRNEDTDKKKNIINNCYTVEEQV